jgi:arylsulfatase A-like enzyme
MSSVRRSSSHASLEPRRALVLAVDGWSAGFLGPYGNTWLETPNCNELASRGMLFEHALVDQPTLEAFYHGVWSGGHAALPAHAACKSEPPLIELLKREGRATCLVTDEPAVAEFPVAQFFSRAEGVARLDPRQPAETPDQTQFAHLLATALSAMDEARADLVWIHSSGMTAAWDAPPAWREAYRDEEDPPPPTDPYPPVGPVPHDWTPDDLQGWLWAYAAQVALLDWGMAAVLEAWEQIREPALLIVTGTRGFALGEHGRLGPLAGRLHSEHLHVPLLVLSNRNHLAAARCQQLVQPFDLGRTLRSWFHTEGESEPDIRSLLELPIAELLPDGCGWPPLAVARQAEQWALRTPAWHACLAARSSADRRLYLKPDDRWEVNDVADRCPEVIEHFAELQRSIEQLPPDASLQSLPPLAPDLLLPP